ncbi:MAG TPA: D-2-hydroxyacid dehydrogenase [Methylomirabilota bacterium]|jgi:phosphoglycerate dehydrogenase-like enzyme|nr:D-2-hydroxyacid dehydrogenase [Methylomirabilota bacterium]
MSDPLVVMIACPLEPEHVDRIRAVDPRIELLHDPDLVPRPRYVADHAGSPTKRTPEQEARFVEMLGRAEVVFDFPSGHYRDLPAVAPRLRWLQSTSAGIGQMVKRVGLDQTDITFTTASGVHARPLADFCLMAMLMFAKNYQWMDRDKKAKRWERYCGEELTGKTLAIVGIGRVGQEVARHGKRMDMRVTGMRRSDAPVPDVDKLFDRAELHAMLREADFLVLAAPHTPETEGIIGEREIAVLKPSAVLINIGRGALVDEDALIRALQEKRLAGAALDVLREEPPPQDSPLWDMPNVIISPHSASTVTQENARITAIFCDNLRRYMDGQPLRNVLDKTKLY